MFLSWIQTLIWAVNSHETLFFFNCHTKAALYLEEAKYTRRMLPNEEVIRGSIVF